MHGQHGQPLASPTQPQGSPHAEPPPAWCGRSRRSGIHARVGRGSGTGGAALQRSALQPSREAAATRSCGASRATVTACGRDCQTHRARRPGTTQQQSPAVHDALARMCKPRSTRDARAQQRIVSIAERTLNGDAPPSSAACWLYDLPDFPGDHAADLPVITIPANGSTDVVAAPMCPEPRRACAP